MTDDNINNNNIQTMKITFMGNLIGIRCFTFKYGTTIKEVIKEFGVDYRKSGYYTLYSISSFIYKGFPLNINDTTPIEKVFADEQNPTISVLFNSNLMG